MHFMNFDDHNLLLSDFIIVFLYLQLYIDWWLQLVRINQDYIPITSGVAIFNGIN